MSEKRYDSTQHQVLESPDHARKELCTTRLPYRDGRTLKAVKVFTVCDESIYVLAHHVPALNLHEELRELFLKFGELDSSRILEEYPAEQFAQVHLFKFKKVVSARLAKLKMDDYNFHGAVLHVHYAPELETMEETRTKLDDRRREVGYRLWRNQKDLKDREEHRRTRFDQMTGTRESVEKSAEQVKSKPVYGPRFNPCKR